MDKRIFRLKAQILNALQDDWTVEKMSAAVNLSEPHLLKLFKKETGISPISFIRDVRLEKSRKLLEDTFLQIKQICVELGIKNETHFTRDFKKKYEVTPTEYRKQHWIKIQAEYANGQK